MIYAAMKMKGIIRIIGHHNRAVPWCTSVLISKCLFSQQQQRKISMFPFTEY